MCYRIEHDALNRIRPDRWSILGSLPDLNMTGRARDLPALNIHELQVGKWRQLYDDLEFTSTIHDCRIKNVVSSDDTEYFIRQRVICADVTERRSNKLSFVLRGFGGPWHSVRDETAIDLATSNAVTTLTKYGNITYRLQEGGTIWIIVAKTMSWQFHTSLVHAWGLAQRRRDDC